jgi:hypothetical protein
VRNRHLCHCVSYVGLRTNKVRFAAGFTRRECVVKAGTAHRRILKYIAGEKLVINTSGNVHTTGVTGNIDPFKTIHVTEAWRHLSEGGTITAGSLGTVAFQ